MKRITAVLATTLLFVVQPALAETDVESELAKMREVMQGLQEKVEAQDEQLKHQKELLEDAQTAVRDQQERTESLSGLSQFLDMVDVDGHVAGSYNWNFNTPKAEHGGVGLNQGAYGLLPFHPDHNTFTVDQIWFGIGKPATEESPGGFRFDILYGNNANFLGQGTGFSSFHDFTDGRLDDIDLDDDADEPGFLSRRWSSFDSTSDYYIAQAYVEYTSTIVADGLNFKFGKFQTPVGAEVIQSPANYNITRGNVYVLLQPVDHLGLISTLDLGMFEVGGGVVNSGESTFSSPDWNDEKSYIGTAQVGNDRMSLRTTFIYGADAIPFADGKENSVDDVSGTNSTRRGLADVTAFFNPADNVGLWANYNYLFVEGSGLYAHGIAVAGRVGITDRLGAALRGEYVFVNGPNDGEVSGADVVVDRVDIYSLTGTLDFALTDHLTARGEVRFDWINDPGAAGFGFLENSTGFADNQTVALAEVVYEF